MTAKILYFRDYHAKLKEKPPPGTTAQIFQFKDYQKPQDIARMYGTLEQQAVGIFNIALIGPGGIDDLLTPDTAPSEYCAPLDDPA